MDLGAFSISLAVKDIAASKEFYKKLGFQVFGGDESNPIIVSRMGEHRTVYGKTPLRLSPHLLSPQFVASSLRNSPPVLASVDQLHCMIHRNRTGAKKKTPPKLDSADVVRAVALRGCQ